LRRFICATVEMLSKTERCIYQAELAELVSQVGNLTDSVRETLKLASLRNSYLTAVEVRDHLKKSGFDFCQYISNPFSSVRTIFWRFKADEVETSSRDDGSRDAVPTQINVVLHWVEEFKHRVPTDK
jgi:hypothetical protein